MAKDSGSLDDLALSKSTYGLVFLGVPNLGLRYEELRAMVKGQPNQGLIDDLVVDKESEAPHYLTKLNEKFIQTCKEQKFKIVSYYETKLSDTVKVCKRPR